MHHWFRYVSNVYCLAVENEHNTKYVNSTEFDFVTEGFRWLRAKNISLDAASPAALQDVVAFASRGDLRSAIPRMYRHLNEDTLALWWHVLQFSRG
jgi:hypothetical protein